MLCAKHRGRPREDSDADVLGYKVYRVLGGNHIVRTFRRDPLSLRRGENCGMDGPLKAFREHDPLVVCQILQADAFLASHWVSFWKSYIRGGFSKWHTCDLN